MNEDKKTIYCIQCGSENPETAKFCSNCGAKIEQPAKPQPPQFAPGRASVIFSTVSSVLTKNNFPAIVSKAPDTAPITRKKTILNTKSILQQFLPLYPMLTSSAENIIHYTAEADKR